MSPFRRFHLTFPTMIALINKLSVWVIPTDTYLNPKIYLGTREMSTRWVHRPCGPRLWSRLHLLPDPCRPSLCPRAHDEVSGCWVSASAWTLSSRVLENLVRDSVLPSTSRLSILALFWQCIEYIKQCLLSAQLFWLSWWRICLQCRRPGFNSWGEKIPWRRERLPTPVFWPGEFHELYSSWGHKESDTTERLSVSQLAAQLFWRLGCFVLLAIP